MTLKLPEVAKALNLAADGRTLRARLKELRGAVLLAARDLPWGVRYIEI